MSDKSKIQWTDFTSGPWHLCSKVSDGCKNCYAWVLMMTRLWPIIRKAWKAAGIEDWETREVWGENAPRVLSKGFWEKAIALDRKAKREGVRYKMFPSMIDWLDDMPAGIIDQDGNQLVSHEVRAQFLDIIRLTTNLDWLLLTKRSEEWGKHIMFSGVATEFGGKNPELCAWLRDWLQGNAPSNVWIGCTVENQAMADKRIPELVKIPARVRFLSVEPMLEEISLGSVDATFGDKIHWVIVGGESGSHARPFNIEWARSIVQQCKAAGVACFVKQLGDFPHRGDLPLTLHAKKGGDWNEWRGPEADLRVREFPTVEAQ